ncbi:hypothetical protein ABVK25_012231 [Lepraria finkii]|uniref:Uncharacterized protein n=1 Tax=Lepraria finkii TaxID=1340010 RepID=A0ABR4AH46_9LECA
MPSTKTLSPMTLSAIWRWTKPFYRILPQLPLPYDPVLHSSHMPGDASSDAVDPFGQPDESTD